MDFRLDFSYADFIFCLKLSNHSFLRVTCRDTEMQDSGGKS